MKNILIGLFLLASSSKGVLYAHAPLGMRGTACPPDTIKPVAELEGRLSRQQTWTGAALTDPAYAGLHGLYSFRQLIKKYAGTQRIRLAAPGEPGVPTLVEGYVLLPSGEPAAGALVYVYQCDSLGRYVENGSLDTNVIRQKTRLFAYLKTDDNGYFAFETIRPGIPKAGMPQRIHCEIRLGDQFLRTELFFKDDPNLDHFAAFWALNHGGVIAPNTGIAKRPMFKYGLMLP